MEHIAIYDQLLERALEQHGYVTTRDARDLSVDPTQLRQLAAHGRLDHVTRGVYRMVVIPRSQHGDLAEAVAWTLGRGVVSHESALVLHGIAEVNPSGVHLSVPRENYPRAAGGDLYRLHRRDLSPAIVTEAVAQFMSSLTDDNGRPLFLIKGGVSLELRQGISTSRTSKDLDAVLRADMMRAHENLANAGFAGWEGVAAVPVEVSSAEAGNADQYDRLTSEALTLAGLPASEAVPCMTLSWQVAQKLHACTDFVVAPRTNDRTHDLVDLLLIEALLADEQLRQTREACVAVFEVRAKQAWPPNVVPPPHWDRIYERALEGLDTLGLPPTVEEAAEQVQAFATRIETA